MGTAFGVVDVVAEAEDIFMKFVNILEGGLDLNAFGLTLEINNIADTVFVFIQIFNKADNAVGLMKFQMFRCFVPAVVINNRQFRVQISGFVEAADNFILFKLCFFKNFTVRKK